jgi:type VI secretion system protein ImpF
MARQEHDAPVTLSVIDRLIDLDPKSTVEAPLTRSQSLRLLKAALRRDLEWLLNTRQNADPVDSSYPQAETSFLNYGLPELTTVGVASVQDQARLRRSIEKAVATFEPRIAATRVNMEVLSSNVRGFRFHIQAMLRVRPTPEPIVFDTLLELPAGQYEVKGT